MVSLGAKETLKSKGTVMPENDRERLQRLEEESNRYQIRRMSGDWSADEHNRQIEIDRLERRGSDSAGGDEQGGGNFCGH